MQLTATYGLRNLPVESVDSSEIDRIIPATATGSGRGRQPALGGVHKSALSDLLLIIDRMLSIYL